MLGEAYPLALAGCRITQSPPDGARRRSRHGIITTQPGLGIVGVGASQHAESTLLPQKTGEVKGTLR